jgi:hypothetical protein
MRRYPASPSTIDETFLCLIACMKCWTTLAWCLTYLLLGFILVYIMQILKLIIKLFNTNRGGWWWRRLASFSLSRASSLQLSSPWLRWFGGNPRSMSPELDFGDTLGVILPLESIVFGSNTREWGQKVERCTSHCVDNGEFRHCYLCG